MWMQPNLPAVLDKMWREDVKRQGRTVPIGYGSEHGVLIHLVRALHEEVDYALDKHHLQTEARFSSASKMQFNSPDASFP
jgi:hypothetical protein